MSVQQIHRASRVESELLELVEDEVQELGYQLWDILWIPHQRIVRVFISHPDMEYPVTISDCEKVSRNIDALIEASGMLQDRYYLEVSSLGESPYIRTVIQLSRFKDERLEFTDLNGKRYKGVLKTVEGTGKITWTPEGLSDSSPVESHISDYQRIRLKPSHDRSKRYAVK